MQSTSGHVCCSWIAATHEPGPTSTGRGRVWPNGSGNPRRYCMPVSKRVIAVTSLGRGHCSRPRLRVAESTTTRGPRWIGSSGLRQRVVRTRRQRLRAGAPVRAGHVAAQRPVTDTGRGARRLPWLLLAVLFAGATVGLVSSRLLGSACASAVGGSDGHRGGASARGAGIVTGALGAATCAGAGDGVGGR